jgi:hypothetical protein
MGRLGLTSGFARLSDVAVALAGVHAQVMTSAEVAIGLRVPGVTRADVRASDALVRTYGPRGTVHLFAAADLGRWTSFLSLVSEVPATSGLTREQGDLLVDAIDAALACDADLVMDELDAAVVARVGDWAGELCMPAFGGMWPRWRHVLPLASMRGILCFGASRGRLVTYRRPLLTAMPDVTPAEVVPWAVRAYLHAYGPSTPARFANWLAIDQARAEPMFAAADLEPVDVEGTAAWVAAGSAADAAADAVPGVRLLPYFDSYSYRVGVLCPERMYPGAAGPRALRGAYQNLVVDGLVAGVWQQRRTGRKIAVTVEPTVRLSARQRELVAEQASLLAAIQEGTLSSVVFGTVSSGAHA